MVILWPGKAAPKPSRLSKAPPLTIRGHQLRDNAAREDKLNPLWRHQLLLENYARQHIQTEISSSITELQSTDGSKKPLHYYMQQNKTKRRILLITRVQSLHLTSSLKDYRKELLHWKYHDTFNKNNRVASCMCKRWGCPSKGAFLPYELLAQPRRG